MAQLAFITLLLTSTFLCEKLISSQETIKCSAVDCKGKLACATIYTNSEYKGFSQCHTFTKNNCINLDTFWSAGRVSSVNPHDTCVALHTQHFCQGIMTEIRQDTKGREHLGKMRINDMTMSISPCKEENFHSCTVEVRFSTKLNQSELSVARKEVVEAVDKITSTNTISHSCPN